MPTIWETAHCILLCYFVVIVSQWIPIKIQSFYRCFWVILGLIDAVIELGCFYTCGSFFSNDTIAIICATNLNESVEFFNTYFSLELLIFIMMLLAIIIIIHIYKRQINTLGKYFSIFSLFALGALSFFCIKGSDSFQYKFYTKYISLMTYDMPPSLVEYQKELKIEIPESVPDCVVVILGESFTKSHSSLYGYDKNTNPRLMELSEDGSLIVFENVLAPGTNTIPCIKSVLSTYDKENDNELEWYECQTLPSLMSSAGYFTLWISNQSPSGIYDNVASRYAELCDSCIWVGNKFQGVHKQHYDGFIVEELNSLNWDEMFSHKKKVFVIIHLMGSHCAYSNRYPEEFKVFTGDDYPDLKENQRMIISEYDNSLLYNDRVVSNIFDYFSSKETLAFYFPDHGLDLYETDENHYGYAIENNCKSVETAKQIPYFIYMSPSSQVNYKQIYNRVLTNKNRSFSSSQTMELLIDLLDLQIIGEE